MPSLIELQLEVLLARDLRGRLTTTRDAASRPAPRVFLGRSAEGNVFGVRADVARETRETLERWCAREPALDQPAAAHPPAIAPRVRALLDPVEREWRGPAYVLPEALPRDDRARIVTTVDPTLEEAFPWIAREIRTAAPIAVAYHERIPVSLCHSPRGCTAAAAEAGVETRAPWRSRGLATAAVACWARAVQASGRLALYSTSWDNEASMGVARRLGARLYGEDWHLT